MLKNVKLVMITASLTVLSACTTVDPKSGHEISQLTQIEDITLVGASSRLVIKNKNGTHCIGPSPDASFSDSMGMGINVSLLNFGDDTSDDSFDDAHLRNSLGGRNPNVLITRELLFEACLLGDRAGLSQAQIIDIYKSTLATIEKINSQSLDGEAITSDNPETAFSFSDGTSSVSSSSTSSSSDSDDDD